MTDKEQIMIDGVDVRNCKGIDLSLPPLVKCKYLKFKTSDGGIAGIWCSDHTNCCFKQLARKTQECEQKDKELKELKRQYKLSCLDCGYKNTKADVERYRKECNFWKHQAELGSETTDRLAKQLEEKEQEREELKEYIQANKPTGICETCTAQALIQNDKYRKALNEIEKVCLKDTYTFADGTQIRYDTLDDILNIIDKVKKE